MARSNSKLCFNGWRLENKDGRETLDGDSATNNKSSSDTDDGSSLDGGNGKNIELNGAMESMSEEVGLDGDRAGDVEDIINVEDLNEDLDNDDAFVKERDLHRAYQDGYWQGYHRGMGSGSRYMLKMNDFMNIPKYFEGFRRGVEKRFLDGLA